MARKKKYRLYAMNVSEESMAIAQDERFSRITPRYVLVYAKRKHPEWGGAEITEQDISILTPADRRWLTDCNMALIATEISDNRSSFVSNLEIKIAELEKALIREKEMVDRHDSNERTEKTPIQ